VQREDIDLNSAGVEAADAAPSTCTNDHQPPPSPSSGMRRWRNWLIMADDSMPVSGP